MRKFVVVGNGQRKGQIGEHIHDLYDGAAVDIEFGDGIIMFCVLSDLREIDDSPIEAGDEVVCVDNDGYPEEFTVGKTYLVGSIASKYVSASNDKKMPGALAISCFAKVKPCPNPEAKQVAESETKQRFATWDEDSGTTWYDTEQQAIDAAKEVVATSGPPVSCLVLRAVAVVEPSTPKVTRLDGLRRIDQSGRDVTDLPGLWSEDDERKEF